MLDGLKDTLLKVKEAFAGKNYVDDDMYDDDDYVEDEVSEYDDAVKSARGYSNVKYMDSYKETKKSYTPMSFVSKSSEAKNDGLEKVIIYAPKELSDVTYICNDIKSGKTVVINMSDPAVTGETAQRICDFIGGVSYAVDGTIEPISSDILIVVPSGCKITNAVRSDIRRKNIGFAAGFGR
jgi:cell division inhibitor SepF